MCDSFAKVLNIRLQISRKKKSIIRYIDLLSPVHISTFCYIDLLSVDLLSVDLLSVDDKTSMDKTSMDKTSRNARGTKGRYVSVSGLEINGCPSARGTEILLRAPRFLRLSARQALGQNVDGQNVDGQKVDGQNVEKCMGDKRSICISIRLYI